MYNSWTRTIVWYKPEGEKEGVKGVNGDGGKGGYL